MKKKLVIIAAILSVCCLSACNNEPVKPITLDEPVGYTGKWDDAFHTFPPYTGTTSGYNDELPEVYTTTIPYSVEEPDEKFESAVFDPAEVLTESLSESETTTAAPEVTTNNDIVYHSYLYQGEEDGTMSYDRTILVEHNFKKHYVTFQMLFMGYNVYLSPEWDENLNVIDGEYWIQDFGNADGSPPDLTKVYVKWSPSEIDLYYWNTVEECFSNDPQVFVINDKEDSGL